MKVCSRPKSAIALAIATALLPSTAFSQESNSAGNTIEKIEVTATKRATTEQTTAIAMSVVGNEALADSGVTEVNDLGNVAPTLNIAQNNDNTMITIRGVSSRDYSETGDPAVAVNIDNFYLQDSKALNAAMFDIQQVEVLRGPQGTLYGRNATAGAVNIITAKPEFDKELEAKLGFANYGQVNAEVAGNLPINDNWAVRAAAVYRDNDGYRDNGLSEKGDQRKETGARLHVRYESDGPFSMLLTGETVDISGTGSVVKAIPYDDTNADGTLILGDDKNWALNNQGSIDIGADSLRWEFNLDFDDYRVSYIGGDMSVSFDRTNDQDGSADAFLAFPQTNGDISTQNHELRLTSNLDSWFNFQTGVYHFTQDSSGPAYFQMHNTGEYVNIYTFDYQNESSSSAVFAQAELTLSDTLKAEAGIRYTEDEKSQTGQADVGAGTFTQVDNYFKDDEITRHLGLNWEYSEDHFFYGKIDKGYKAGGFKDTSSYSSESIISYEVGSKSFFLDNTMQFNTSLFYYDYTDLQVQQTDPATGVARVYNAGAAGITGAEVEVKYRPTTADTLQVTLALLDAKYDEFCTITADSCPNENDYSGNHLPQAPDVTATIKYTRDFEIDSGVITGIVQSRYQSDNYFSYINRATEFQEAYTKSDVILKYTPDNSSFVYSAYVRNIEDETILTMSEEAAYAGGYLVQFARPRTFGVEVSYRY